MKKLFTLLTLLLLLSMLASCALGNKSQGSGRLVSQPETSLLSGEQEDNEPHTTSYTNETYGYSIELPKEISDHCEITEFEDRDEAVFAMKDGNDMVMAISTVPDDQYGEIFGTKFLGSKDGYTTYVQLPTCGTLSNESARDLWDELVAQAGKLGETDIQYNTN